MPTIKFPNVPKLPGVPALPRSVTVPTTARAALGLLQGILWRVFQVDTRWGIFDEGGKPLADPSRITGILGGALDAAGIGAMVSTDGMDYSKETRVSDFPVERGGFASYNKVEQAATPNVTLCLSGSESDRRKFLDAIDKACKSTELYSVVTPEVTYIGYSLERYSYQRRSSRGATLLLVELSLKEVRQVSASYAISGAAGQVSSPKDSGASPPINAGKVQAKIPEVSTLKSLANKLPSLAEKAGTYLQGALR